MIGPKPPMYDEDIMISSYNDEDDDNTIYAGIIGFSIIIIIIIAIFIYLINI